MAYLQDHASKHRKPLFRSRSARVGTIVLGLFALKMSSAMAVGPRRQVPQQPAEPADRQAFPLRIIELGQVSASSFKLPNGNAVDMNINLKETVDAEINSSDKFRTYQREAPIERHAIIDAALTALELDVVTAGIKLGYRPGGGDVGSGQGLELNGEVTVNVGAISMSFTVYDSVSGETYSAVISDRNTTGLNLSFKVNFDRNFSVGPELQFREQLSRAIRSLVSGGMRALASRPRTNMIPWSAKVREVDAARKLVLFDSGVRGGIVAGDLFRVYKACANDGCLETYTGDIKVKRVHAGDANGSAPYGYSESTVKDDSNGLILDAIKPGDKVYIHYLQ